MSAPEAINLVGKPGGFNSRGHKVRHIPLPRILRFAAMGGLIVAALMGTSLAQSPPLTKTSDIKVKFQEIAAIHSDLAGYTPTPPTYKMPGQKSQDYFNLEATNLLLQMKDAGMGTAMIDRFLASGGYITVEMDPEIANVAQYNPGTRTITIKGATLNDKMGPGTLAGVAHEFWHAYKHQVVDAGYDPDTAAQFNAVMSWLKTQRVTNKDLSGPTPLSELISDFDDFADEFIADAFTQIWKAGPFGTDAKDLIGMYNVLLGLQEAYLEGYENSDGKVYMVQGKLPVPVLMQILRLALPPEALVYTRVPGEPQFLELRYPSIPGEFCTAAEKSAAVAAIDGVLQAAKDNVMAWTVKAGELLRQLEVATDPAIQERLGREVDAAMTATNEADRVKAEIAAYAATIGARNVVECIDPCLVGEWVSTSAIYDATAFEGGKGIRVLFTRDGYQRVDYDNMTKYTFNDGTGAFTDYIYFKGIANSRIRTKDGVASMIEELPGTAAMVLDLKILDHKVSVMPVATLLSPAGLGGTADFNGYTCSADKLSYIGTMNRERTASFPVEFVRVQ